MSIWYSNENKVPIQSYIKKQSDKPVIDDKYIISMLFIKLFYTPNFLVVSFISNYLATPRTLIELATNTYLIDAIKNI